MYFFVSGGQLCQPFFETPYISSAPYKRRDGGSGGPCKAVEVGGSLCVVEVVEMGGSLQQYREASPECYTLQNRKRDREGHKKF